MHARPQLRKRRTDRSPEHRVTSYWDRTQWPLQSLLFLLPLLVVYEIGAVVFAPAGDERLPQIYAERMLGQFFDWLGVTGYHLPAAAAVAVLLLMHLVRRDPWHVEPRLYGVMAVESVLLAAPLFVFSITITAPPPEVAAAWGEAAGDRFEVLGLPELPLLASTASAATGLDAVGSWRQGVTFAIGAGVYEELVFRLIVIALVHVVLSDLLALPGAWSAGGAIVISALAFALYHPFDSHLPWAWSAGDWGRFSFYTLAGLYFAAIYVYRGFGIVAATHALYDVMVIATHFAGR
ncbi:MAG: CPBP family intramembrane glutamic endopeptidase [Planctomycetota bacterium]